LHRGNALAALGREDDARASYEKVFPMLEKEPRCGRLDWERHSLYVNIGNTYSRQGDYEKANENFTIAEKLGRDHVAAEEPAYSTDGYAMVIVAMRARAFALKKACQEEEGKKILKDVITMQIKLDVELEKKAEEEKKKAEEEGVESGETVPQVEEPITA
jgi:tetratricopeptide (TPR) repeat protein